MRKRQKKKIHRNAHVEVCDVLNFTVELAAKQLTELREYMDAESFPSKRNLINMFIETFVKKEGD